MLPSPKCSRSPQIPILTEFRPSGATVKSNANAQERDVLELLFETLNNQDQDLLDSVTGGILKTSGMKPTSGTASQLDGLYIISEIASTLQSKAMGLERNAELNFEFKYGPFQRAVDLANLTHQAYKEGFVGGSCADFVLLKSGNVYNYTNPRIIDPATKKTFQHPVLDRNERGEEYRKSGNQLLPDSIVWDQSGPYEWHPYISKVMSKRTGSLRNKFPSFMVRRPPLNPVLCTRLMRNARCRWDPFSTRALHRRPTAPGGTCSDFFPASSLASRSTAPPYCRSSRQPCHSRRTPANAFTTTTRARIRRCTPRQVSCARPTAFAIVSSIVGQIRRHRGQYLAAPE